MQYDASGEVGSDSVAEQAEASEIPVGDAGGRLYFDGGNTSVGLFEDEVDLDA